MLLFGFNPASECDYQAVKATIIKRKVYRIWVFLTRFEKFVGSRDLK